MGIEIPLRKTAEKIRIEFNNPPDEDKKLLFFVPEMIQGLILKTFLWKYQGCCKYRCVPTKLTGN